MCRIVAVSTTVCHYWNQTDDKLSYWSSVVVEKVEKEWRFASNMKSTHSFFLSGINLFEVWNETSKSGMDVVYLHTPLTPPRSGALLMRVHTTRAKTVCVNVDGFTSTSPSNAIRRSPAYIRVGLDSQRLSLKLRLVTARSGFDIWSHWTSNLETSSDNHCIMSTSARECAEASFTGQYKFCLYTQT